VIIDLSCPRLNLPRRVEYSRIKIKAIAKADKPR
jgi:hypothetical protein